MRSDGKVLLVLGDAEEAARVASGLESAGLSTLTATDGISGLAMVSEHKPNVVLCAQTLPKMDGLQVCRLIKRNHKLKHVAVLLVLDESNDSSAISGLELGANDYLLRPLHMAELIAAVRSHVNDRTSIARLKDDNRELATILEIAELLTSTLNSSDLFDIVVGRLAEALETDDCCLLRIEGGRRALVEASLREDRPQRVVPLETVPEVGRALAVDKMVYVEDARRDSELSGAHGTEDALSVIAAPLHVRRPGDQRIVFRMARRGDPFTYREIKFCQIVTTVAANALENAYLYESLEIAHHTLSELSKRDPLTDVYNRRYLFERMEVEHERAMGRGQPFACLLLDVDHFKQINDRFGHQVGDAVLIGMGRVLRSCLRGQDTVGRYGGEEFLAILPDTDAPQALRVAERIRDEIRRFRFDGLDGEQVTVSAGMATTMASVPQPEGIEALIARADEALYAAKNGGRDRALLHDAETATEAEPEPEPEPVTVSEDQS